MEASSVLYSRFPSSTTAMNIHHPDYLVSFTLIRCILSAESGLPRLCGGYGELPRLQRFYDVTSWSYVNLVHWLGVRVVRQQQQSLTQNTTETTRFDFSYSQIPRPLSNSTRTTSPPQSNWRPKCRCQHRQQDLWNKVLPRAVTLFNHTKIHNFFYPPFFCVCNVNIMWTIFVAANTCLCKQYFCCYYTLHVTNIPLKFIPSGFGF